MSTSLHVLLYGSYSFESRYSTIKINAGATFVVNNPVTNFNGTLIKESNAMVTGDTITFEQGIFEDAGNSIMLAALFNPTTNALTLAGNDSFRAQPGTILQSILVSSFNNMLSGQPIFGASIALTDVSSTLTLAVQTRVNQDITLNNGIVILEDDIKFTGNHMFVGPGTINGNGYHIQTGGESFTHTTALAFQDGSLVEIFARSMNLTSSLTFQGICALNGHGNVLDMQSGGQLIIDSGATLDLSDITLKGVGANSFAFTDDDSQLHIGGNVFFEFIDDVTLSQGGILIDGPTTFIIKDHTLTVDSSASMTVDGMTLWLDPAGQEADCSVDNIIFGSPMDEYLTLVASGTIKKMISCTDLNAITGSFNSDVQFLQDQIDTLDTSTQFLQDQIDMLDTSTQSLQDQVDLLDSSTQNLQEQIDTLDTSTQSLQDQIDMLDTSTQSLQDQIDAIVTSTTSTFTCRRIVSGTLLFTLDMLPPEGDAVYFEFSPCYGPMADRPTVVFDPAVYGNGGVVPLVKNSRVIFAGDGRVELKDGVTFEYAGTSIADGPQADWPELVLEGGADMHLDTNATVLIGGEGGKFTVRDCAAVILDEASQLIFGDTPLTTELLVRFDCASRLQINNADALVTFHVGIFDVLFDNHSSLDIMLGTVEMNTLNGNESAGIMRTLHLTGGSSLRINKDGVTSGLLRLAPNTDDFFMDVDTRAGVIHSGGNMQFVSFGATPVNTIVQIQDRDIALEQEVVEAFMQLSFSINQELNPQPPEASIIVLRGSLPDPTLDGTLAALCPARNGSIVSLEFGDHDVRYDGNVITGKNMIGRTFRIFNCDATQRVVR